MTLYLHVEVYVGSDFMEHLPQGRNTRSSGGAQLVEVFERNFSQGSALFPVCRVVVDHHVPIPRGVNVEFDAVCAELNGTKKGLEGILGSLA